MRTLSAVIGVAEAGDHTGYAGTVTLGCHRPTVTPMTRGRDGDTVDLAAEQARLVMLRQHLGAHLAASRQAAGVTQPELARALDRTRTTVSKVEHGTRRMPARLWKIADDLCRADGELITEHTALTQAEDDYRGLCRAHRRTARKAAAQAQLDALRAAPASAVLHVPGGDAWPETTLISGEIVGEFMAMVTRLVQSVGRRHAMQLANWMLATISISGLDPDDYTRVAHAVANPSRVDAQVINNLTITLASCKRLEDTLGPGEVLDTVTAAHAIVRRLLTGCSEQLRKPLRLLDSIMATTIGGYLTDLGQPHMARRYFAHARKAAHDAANPASAAYAAQAASFAARLCGDVPAALDTAAAARSLAARTNDYRLKALAEQMAAGAYALDGQYDSCMAAFARAHEFLTNINGAAPDSPVYWVSHSSIDKHFSKALILLNKPAQAIEAAHTALTHYDRTYIGGYAMSEIRLGHALILDKEITEATRILANAGPHAQLYPRLTTELHTARALLQPWANTHPVQTLDDQLRTCGLIPDQKI